MGVEFPKNEIEKHINNFLKKAGPQDIQRFAANAENAPVEYFVKKASDLQLQIFLQNAGVKQLYVFLNVATEEQIQRFFEKPEPRQISNFLYLINANPKSDLFLQNVGEKEIEDFNSIIPNLARIFLQNADADQINEFFCNATPSIFDIVLQECTDGYIEEAVVRFVLTKAALEQIETFYKSAKKNHIEHFVKQANDEQLKKFLQNADKAQVEYFLEVATREQLQIFFQHVGDNEQSNARMHALWKTIKLVKPILMKLATLSLKIQTDLLQQFPHVLFYAAENDPTLFDNLLDVILTLPVRPRWEIISAKNRYKQNSLMLAAQLGNNQSLVKLLDFLGMPLEDKDCEGNTALHWAVHNKHNESVRLILSKGANVNARDTSSKTPLILAVQIGHKEIISTLLECADIEAKDTQDRTALHWAIINGDTEIVLLLLSKGAKLTSRDNADMNPLDLALKYKPELVELLLAFLNNLPLYEQAECLREVDKGLYDDVKSYYGFKQADIFPNFNAESARIIINMGINRYIWEIKNNYLLMKKDQTNPNNVVAAITYKILFNELIQARIQFYTSSDDLDKRVLHFKNVCQQAIEEAKPVLQKPPKYFGFFSKEPEEKLLKELQSCTKKMR